ncbi:MAG TPA: tRNA (adenosine(37)-N6)-threonylcarbamoyltransferase complex transferase subunit TsaD [Thermoanaerobaculia bacterium]|nr:tRNA (adenosine(37)-N6)-threonylcarbamoyltransferase complex transferase subunit TsaD [Thermoanaerobaculia bacterium]
MRILGIDTTCDDTGVGIVEDGTRILSNVIASQHASHERYGGIVPVIAARQHVRNVNLIVEAALREAGCGFRDLDAVAVTNEQGLLLSLVVGVAAAKSIALALDLPLVGLHHIEGHVYSNLVEHGERIGFPFLCLTVAGGHTLILKVEGHGRYALLGHTRDDAAGEAYDKIARRLGLGYPGGPVIDRLANDGDPAAFRFPRPLLHEEHFELSFSGLKSSVLRTIEKLEAAGEPVPVEDLCASFQQAVVDVLVGKTLRVAEAEGIDTITVAGGVALNSRLRADLRKAADEKGLQLYHPRPGLCVDNGAMIAGAAYWLHRDRGASPLTIDAVANAPRGALGVRYKHATKYR